VIPANARAIIVLDHTDPATGTLRTITGTLLKEYDGSEDVVMVRSGSRTIAIPGYRVLYIEGERTEAIYPEEEL
jgi:hypothetical protein